MQQKQQSSHEEILEKLSQIQSDIEVLKERLPVDPDTIMTEEEKRELEESLAELERGDVYTLEDIKRDRENAGLKV